LLFRAVGKAVEGINDNSARMMLRAPVAAAEQMARPADLLRSEAGWRCYQGQNERQK